MLANVWSRATGSERDGNAVSPAAPETVARRREQRHRGLGVVLVAAVGLIAYHNSLSAPFLFDDELSIVQNPRLRQLWPVWQVMTGTMRPLVDLSFAVNYALGGLRVEGYHAVNLLLHLIAALLLFGIVRRTLCGGWLRARYSASVSWLAAAVAAIWVAHPLHTGAVTYLVQRAELLMGCCYLLTVYGLIRGAEAPGVVPSADVVPRDPRQGTSATRDSQSAEAPGVASATRDSQSAETPGVASAKSDSQSAEVRSLWWSCVAVAACAAGMASKPVMVTAPVAALVYDRVFLTGSFREALRRRRWFYVGLAATWGLLVALVAAPWPAGEPSAGFALKEITPWRYAATQPGVILHYLRLAAWPNALCFDYAWPPAQRAGAILLPLAVMAALASAVVWAWRHDPALGFLGVWLVLTLAPTSSLVPIADLAVEYRMYLPLMALVMLAVLGGEALLRRLFGTESPWQRGCAVVILVGLVAALVATTVRRNHDYRSAIAIWSDTVVKRPVNPRAWNNLGLALAAEGRLEESTVRYAEALRLDPTYAMAHNNWGMALVEAGRLDEAIVHLEEALRLRPDYAKGYSNLGVALAKVGRLDEAIAQYTEAIRLKPDLPEAHNNLGNALVHRGRFDEAIGHYAGALRLRPDYAQVHNNWGLALSRQGRYAEAMAQYRESLRVWPDNAEAHHNLGNALAREGRFDEAIMEYAEALRLKPSLAETHQNWANVLLRQGRLEEAVGHYRDVIQRRPSYAEAHYNLGVVLIKQGLVQEGREHLAAAIRLKPSYRRGLGASGGER